VHISKRQIHFQGSSVCVSFCGTFSVTFLNRQQAGYPSSYPKSLCEWSYSIGVVICIFMYWMYESTSVSNLKEAPVYFSIH